MITPGSGELLGTLVPVAEVQLPIIRSEAAFDEALVRMLESDLLGFIVRRAGLDGTAIGSNRMLADKVVESLLSSGYSFESVYALPGFTVQPTRGIGGLHIDRLTGRSVQTLNLHTTIEGQGNVLLAESGKQKGRKSNLNEFDKRKLLIAALHEELLEGRTDPNIMRPVVHKGWLARGDHIIFPLVNKNGPVWHRFDTASRNRNANISELDRDRNAERSLRKALGKASSKKS